ncbi:proteasome assembly chaperone family protein [Propionibacteriaceae bacterium Y2011]|uniref:proteasome assembly chaperone family protein n=1 Tax=Microlunatus sp. Y2014 TaxID=3418488 RepID=UPI003B4B8241
MTGPESLYRIEPEVAASLAGTRPVLLNLLEGFVDAGQVSRSLVSTMLTECEHETLAVFDHDKFHDYRSRRPVITFDTNRFTDVDDIHVLLHRMTDAHGESFLLLEGPEPDARWEQVMADVIELIAQFDVRLTVSVHGIPMAVPHTRPVTTTVHGTDEELIRGQRSWMDRVEIPASFSSLLEYRLGRLERSAHGFAVHVPHYVAQSAFSPAAVTAMEQVAQVTGLALPLEALREATANTIAELTAETEHSEEVQRVVAELEVQYDAFVSRDDASLPSADEIGAAFEQFLRENDDES